MQSWPTTTHANLICNKRAADQILHAWQEFYKAYVTQRGNRAKHLSFCSLRSSTGQFPSMYTGPVLLLQQRAMLCVNISVPGKSHALLPQVGCQRPGVRLPAWGRNGFHTVPADYEQLCPPLIHPWSASQIQAQSNDN